MPVIQSEEEKGEELGFPPILSFKFYSFGLELLHFTDLVSPLLCENHQTSPHVLVCLTIEPSFLGNNLPTVAYSLLYRFTDILCCVMKIKMGGL